MLCILQLHFWINNLYWRILNINNFRYRIRDIMFQLKQTLKNASAQTLSFFYVETESCFWTVVLKKTLESPLDSKEIKPVNPKGNQPWIFIGRTGAEAEAPTLRPPDVNSQLTGKDPDAGKDWGQEKAVTEDETVGWHHLLSGHGFEQTLGDGEGQGSLACCSPRGCKASDMT